MLPAFLTLLRHKPMAQFDFDIASKLQRRSLVSDHDRRSPTEFEEKNPASIRGLSLYRSEDPESQIPEDIPIFLFLQDTSGAKLFEYHYYYYHHRNHSFNKENIS